MAEIYQAEIKNLRSKNKLYTSGKISINEETKTIKLTYDKKALFGNKIEILQEINYKSSTKFEAQGSAVTLDEISFEVSSTESLNKIREMVTKPRKDETERKEKLLEEADESVKDFLIARAAMLGELNDLLSNPRKSLLSLWDSDIAEDEDLLQLYHSKISSRVLDESSNMETKLTALKNDIEEDKIQKIYALVYGIGSVQKAILFKDSKLLSKSFSLIEKVTSKKLSIERYADPSIINITEKLYSEVSILNDKLIGA